MSPGCFTIILILTLLGSAIGGLWGDIVEEETWYNASGQVVKTVKRTFTGADAVRSSSWEPAWIAREREQARRLRGGSTRFWSGSSGFRSYSYGWGGGCYPVTYSYRRPYGCAVPYRRGFTFSYRGGNWSAVYRGGYHGGYRGGCRVIAY